VHLAARALLNSSFVIEYCFNANMGSNPPSFSGPPQRISFQGLLFDMDGVRSHFFSILPTTKDFFSFAMQ
jgi:hypothetical protein